VLSDVAARVQRLVAERDSAVIEQAKVDDVLAAERSAAEEKVATPCGGTRRSISEGGKGGRGEGVRRLW